MSSFKNTEKGAAAQASDGHSVDTDREQGSTHSIGSTYVHGRDSQRLQRKLGAKEVQLFALSAAIGTSIFVTIGTALPKAGPAGLFIGFLIWGVCVLCVNECYGRAALTPAFRVSRNI
ncbi:uncharacterized protein DSM5745_10298 [Aspergillus mulundensis]|uniref:Amino acid permease/ SLC12A domain-containing protein n=1 Tax=Aspergillus mulundensis TaxID=1810919 RepID=A0A3D8QN20_9EURO|nr:hypothetical protein DSM5745_10298 [Aspergillus mulundensis]RDW63187.1 hypothetical protein DSM5745_10298 [Aspergillus mulundensis]